MVIILDDVILNLDSIKENISTILKEKEVDIDWCSFEYEHEFKNFPGLPQRQQRVSLGSSYGPKKID